MSEKYNNTRKICKEDLLWIFKVEDMFSILPEGKIGKSKVFCGVGGRHSERKRESLSHSSKETSNNRIK